MTDFATLIDSAVRRDLISQFTTFLKSYRTVEYGRVRAVTADEIALVIACAESFLLAVNVFDLGVTEIANLRERLDAIAGSQSAAGDDVSTADTAFETLACIAALEARLSVALDRCDVIITQLPGVSQLAANDR